MKIISFLNNKGGCGKTTSLINIAYCFSQKGYKVVCLDTDNQASLSKWCAKSKKNFDVYSISDENDIYKIRKSLSSYNYDLLFIDGAGSLSVITASCVMVSDLVIIPISPSPLDFEVSGNVINIIEANARNRTIPFIYLITKAIDNSKMLANIKNNIDVNEYLRFKTVIKNRQSYLWSITDGSIFESKDTAAKAEIELISKELEDFLNKIEV